MRAFWYLTAGIPSALAASTGQFDVLAFNVAGLPAFLNNNDVPGDKKTNSEELGAKFAEYGHDVVQLQEDFNYHAYIYQTDNHPYRTPTSGGAAIGSGLNTLSNYPWVDFQRVKWNSCSDITGADCLTPKGFTSMRVRFDEGLYVDFYNVHADAGSSEKDLSARSDNLQQLADYISTNSVGNPVLVFGDTNARYTSTGENIRVFDEQEGMADPWVQLALNGVEPMEGTPARKCETPTANRTCETVDKIFYRGSRALALNAIYWNYEDMKFLSSTGDIMSDHSPVGSNFTWSRSTSVRQSDLFGGPHGTWFNDLPSIPETSTGGNKPSRISLRGAERLDSVGLVLASGKSYFHGGTGGQVHELALGPDEYWTQAQLCRGRRKDRTRNFYLRATTSSNNTISAGTATDDCQDFAADQGWQIVGFYGQDGDEVDQLGFIYAPQ